MPSFVKTGGASGRHGPGAPHTPSIVYASLHGVPPSGTNDWLRSGAKAQCLTVMVGEGLPLAGPQFPVFFSGL